VASSNATNPLNASGASSPSFLSFVRFFMSYIADLLGRGGAKESGQDDDESFPARPYEPVQPLAGRRVRHKVQLAALVLAERHPRQLLTVDRAVGDHPLLGVVVLEGPDAAGDVVGVEVLAVQ